MNAKPMLLGQFDTMSKQLSAVFHGFPDDAVETQQAGMSMTPIGMIEHLCDCVGAYCSPNPHEYAWGSFKLADRTLEMALSELVAKRQQARAAMDATEDESRLEMAFDFLMSHDAYHVGQLAACRMAADPTWDSMALYS